MRKLFPSFMPLAAVLSASLLFSCTPDIELLPLPPEESPGGTSGTFKDDRDNKTYNWVKIGTQVWMAENLNYDATGSKCYNNETANCNTYGRLYDWATAMALPSNCNSSTCSSQVLAKHKGICPTNWHLPSNAEWTALTDYVGTNAGTKLKAASGWNSYSGVPSGTDIYCFSALPGGYGNSVGSFYNVGDVGRWWSASEYGSYSAYRRGMNYYRESVFYIGYGKGGLFSVRCVQD